MRNLAALFFLLSVLWLALSGVYKPLMLGLGLGSVLFTLWMSKRMDVLGVAHGAELSAWRLPLFWAWLAWQVALSCVHVARLVFVPSRISPRVLRVPVQQASDVGRVTYANSITLTPGTVSLVLNRSELCIHALDQQAEDELRREGMGAKVHWLERGRR
ncbi:Na+/H+ antiporter subunit E [Luteimonas vadosa]|uniref:Na+/H+ antiporter subunit E n=1 Tax=Luteimonas vadosa TaxID=1165507 RepID=A0ABP9DVG4_9GAMM